MLIYLKTTETCNLNCKHCFTSGSKGAKIYWNTDETIDWITRLHEYKPELPNIHFEFHGGEPFLAPIEEFWKVHSACDKLWENMSWGVTSNLVFKLTDEIIEFIQGPLNSRIGTSWDPNIRFANEKQRLLWEKNVRKLLSLGVDIKLFVSVTKDTLDIEPIDLLEYVKSLGIKEMSLERLTNNGNAKLFPEIFPSNIEQDAWFMLMHEQMIEHDARGWLDNDFLETVYSKFESGSTSEGTFCRDCEEKLLTLNADGSISGCPNSAPEDHFGRIEHTMQELFDSPIRINNIACERSRDPRCYTCEVFQYCNSDCHQLEWQGDICGAPKTLMRHLAGLSTTVKKYPTLMIKQL